jgi:hypothetical protein
MNGKVGRPSEWRNAPTQTVRVPESLVPKILEIAHELDAGLHEPMIIRPENLKVQRQEKHASLTLQNIRIYRSSGHDVLRLKELLVVLADALKSGN